MVLTYKLPNDIIYFFKKHIFSLYVPYVFLLANKLVKFIRHTIFPKHIDCFMLALVVDFSFQRKRIEIFCYQNIRMKAKVSIKNVMIIYAVICNFRQKISSFNSCSSVQLKITFFLDGFIILQEILFFCWLVFFL